MKKHKQIEDILWYKIKSILELYWSHEALYDLKKDLIIIEHHCTVPPEKRDYAIA